MYKILLACLPFVFACNMATDKNAGKQKTADTIAVIPQQAQPVTTNVQPQLQAIKWSGIQELTDETFKSQVLASSALTLVDFNADWCGPCKKLKPILDQLVKEYDGKVNFASVDVDECPQAAKYYNVSSIPLLAFYKDAKQGNTMLGLRPYEQLKEMIDAELKGE